MQDSSWNIVLLASFPNLWQLFLLLLWQFHTPCLHPKLALPQLALRSSTIPYTLCVLLLLCFVFKPRPHFAAYIFAVSVFLLLLAYFFSCSWSSAVWQWRMILGITMKTELQSKYINHLPRGSRTSDLFLSFYLIKRIKPEQREMECDGAEIRATLGKQEIDARRESRKTETDPWAPGTADNDSGRPQTTATLFVSVDGRRWENWRVDNIQVSFLKI